MKVLSLFSGIGAFEKALDRMGGYKMELVEIRNNQVVVSSRQVAEKFGKEHRHVLENIRHILDAENSAAKFFSEDYVEYRGQKFPVYLMNRDGFTLLAMSFTGKEALQWKMKYIQAFNEMEKRLQSKAPTSAVMKHIVQLSGGKDSTAMLLMMLERGMPVDEIIFCDTGIEFPAMYEHLNRVEQYTGRKITRLKAKHDFYWWFWCNQKVKGKMAGQFGMSWPGFRSRWCTKRLKTQVTANYLQSAGEYIQYIGIAADEPKRHRNIPDNVRHPLYDWGITEQQALQYCYDHGFDWGGLYEHFDRVSCWLCPLQGIKELRTLRKVFPKLWSKLRVMDALTRYQYRADYSIEQLERRFALEDAQGCLFGDDVND